MGVGLNRFTGAHTTRVSAWAPAFGKPARACDSSTRLYIYIYTFRSGAVVSLGMGEGSVLLTPVTWVLLLLLLL